MIRALVSILFLSLLLSSCKSIKKIKESQALSITESEAITASDSSSQTLQDISKEVEEQEVIETIEQMPIAIDSSGFIVIKTAIVSKKVTKTTKTVDSTKIEAIVVVDSKSDTSNSSELSNSEEVDKASEGLDPIESIAEAVFPTWGKALGSILVVIVPMLWAWWKKRKDI